MQLTDGTTPLELPDALVWTDESWSPERLAVDRSVTGALIVQAGTRQGGRPITLQSPAPDTGVVSWAVRQQLLAWSDAPDRELTLTLADGTEFTVRFRHDDTPLEFTGLGELPGRRGPGTWWSLTLRLMEAGP